MREDKAIVITSRCIIEYLKGSESHQNLCRDMELIQHACRAALSGPVPLADP